MIYLSIETGNAAFADDDGEVARILRVAADRMEGGDREFPLKDINGNTVGGVSEAPVPERNVRLSFSTDNDAFAEDNLPSEAARIIREAADALESGRTSFPLRDSNGNKIGTVEVVKDPAPAVDDSPSP